MPRPLGTADLLAVERFLARIYSCRRIERFAGTVITEIPTLVGADQTTWNDIAPSAGRVEVMAFPEAVQHDERQESLSKLIGEHPLMLHYFRSGDPTAIKVSDYLSPREFHRTRLYDELYRELQYEDHFVMHLFPPGASDQAVVLGRDRRTFTERDREVLNLVRPHIARAYRTARAFHRLRRRLDLELAVVPRQTWMTLDPSGTILEYPARAQRWIYEYFRDDLPRAPRRLPGALEAWLRPWISRSVLLPPPLVRARRRRRLLVHAERDSASRTIVLTLNEQLLPPGARDFRRLGLTPREAEILLQVERGLTNQDVAAELGVSVSTVKRHMEHILEKLGVRTRTAAVARARSLV